MRQHCVTVLDDSLPFKATLAWTDPPAIPLSEFALVNDLNLVVGRPPVEFRIILHCVLATVNQTFNSGEKCKLFTNKASGDFAGSLETTKSGVGALYRLGY